ncbi:T9SS type A sorting domain-containing protein [Taibaiella lutea]|uniref:T9SS type A sorting domain-containing protein n=1 Tax=Taibaiella lutea TaxID=2608001 RepID=A0A5M6CHY7_9BACT|nr:T9SS type A sorting domain-containing protein [Taibaiella lutea]KAA5534724.1 T9SS type A sorting domain-containing protein [Taibaiella lutea]
MKQNLFVLFFLFFLSFAGSIAAQPSRIWASYVGQGFSNNAVSWPPSGTNISQTIYHKGYIYIAGTTLDTIHIATAGTFRPSFNKADYNEAFVAKYDTSGHLIWGTYFGGTSPYINDIFKYSHLNIKPQIAMDNSDNIFLTGYTTDSSGIATANSFLPDFPAGAAPITSYIAKLNNNGQLQWSSYFPDLIFAIACDGNGDLYVSGSSTRDTGIATANTFKPDRTNGLCQTYQTADAYLVKFNTNGQRIWGTYYGGTSSDAGLCIGILPNNDVILGGTTSSSDQIATPGTHQTFSGPANCVQPKNFIARFTGNGQRIWGTYYCDTTTFVSNNHPMKILCDKDEDAFYIAGYTYDTFGIATPNSFKSFNSGKGDLFLAKFTNQGQLDWGTYYGGDGFETLVPENDFNANMDWPRVSLDFNEVGEIFLSSATTSTDNIKTNCSYNPVDTSYGFIAKFNAQGQRLWGSYTDANAGGVTLAVGEGKTFYVSVSTRIDGKATSNAPMTTKLPGLMAGLLAKFEDTFVCVQRNITIQASDSMLRVDSGFMTYKWYKNSTEQNNPNGPVFQLHDSGTYYVVITDSCGCVYTSNTINVNPHGATGIHESDNSKSLTLFPNPNTGHFIIKLNQWHQLNNKGSVQVINVIGNTVYQAEFKCSSEIPFDLSSLIPGVYTVKVKIGDSYNVLKMMKQ